jgi:hypothetical protein
LGLMRGRGYEEETTLLAGESILFCTDLGQGEFMKGNPKPALRFFSHREDVTLNNPLSPPALPRVGGSRSLRLCGPWRIAFQRWQVP